MVPTWDEAATKLKQHREEISTHGMTIVPNQSWRYEVDTKSASRDNQSDVKGLHRNSLNIRDFLFDFQKSGEDVDPLLFRNGRESFVDHTVAISYLEGIIRLIMQVTPQGLQSSPNWADIVQWFFSPHTSSILLPLHHRLYVYGLCWGLWKSGTHAGFDERLRETHNLSAIQYTVLSDGARTRIIDVIARVVTWGLAAIPIRSVTKTTKVICAYI